jgi:hypothetical protein
MSRYDMTASRHVPSPTPDITPFRGEMVPFRSAGPCLRNLMPAAHPFVAIGGPTTDQSGAGHALASTEQSSERRSLESNVPVYEETVVGISQAGHVSACPRVKGQ